MKRRSPNEQPLTMQDDYNTDDGFDGTPDGQDDIKSKTQVKKEMIALQKLGVALSNLTPAQLAKIPLDETLRESIQETVRVKSNIAGKRHMQYVGKLLRSADHEAIQTAHDAIFKASDRVVRQHHTIEKWRDNLILTPASLEKFIQQFPHTDRQQLRQLIRAAQKEASQNKPPASARKLFRLVRETIDHGHDSLDE